MHTDVLYTITTHSQNMYPLSSERYENCIFPVDDFLPALHSFHPRPDVRELPCAAGSGLGGENVRVYSFWSARASTTHSLHGSSFFFGLPCRILKNQRQEAKPKGGTAMETIGSAFGA